MKVIFMFTRYSTILPPSIFSFCSWIQAPFTFWRVLFARSIPIRVASSKLLVDEAVISVTLATAMAGTPFIARRFVTINGNGVVYHRLVRGGVRRAGGRALGFPARRPLFVLRSVQPFVAGPEAPALESPQEDREKRQGREREHEPPLDGPRAALLLPRIVLARGLPPFLGGLVLLFPKGARQGRG